MQPSHFAVRNLLRIRFIGLSVKNLIVLPFAIMVCAVLPAAAQTGSLSFSTDSYSVNEGVGNAVVTLKRTGGTDNKVVAKVTLADVTTSPADYFPPGTLDSSFNYDIGTGSNGSVYELALQPDGKILIGGGFTSYNGDPNASNYIARLNSDGTLDTSFNYGAGTRGPNDAVSGIAVQPDGKILISGLFTSYNGDPNASNYIARLNSDGTLDTSFNYGTGKGPDNWTFEIAVQPDGKIIIGGRFTSYNGDPNASDYIARLNSDGTLDTSFNYGIQRGVSDSSGVIDVYKLTLQPDGKIIIAGYFDTYNGDARAGDGIIRVHSNGSLDTSFNYNRGSIPVSRAFYATVLQPDGKIIVSGNFSNFNGDPNAHYIARLNSDGTLDTSFSYGMGTGPEGGIFEMALQPDGKIIVGGHFNGYNSDPNASDSIVRLNPDGTLDTSFNYGINKGPNESVGTLALQPDGKIIIGGSFTSYNGDPKAGDFITRLNGDLFATWEAGDAADKSIQIPIVGDALDEENETLTLTLILLTGGAGTPSTATLTIINKELTFSQVSGRGAMGDTATLTAKLTSGGAALSGKTVNFSLNSRSVGQATTDANGVATLSNVGIGNMTAGTYPNAVGASFAGDAIFSGISGAGPLTVVQRVVHLSSASYSVGEGAGRAIITVNRNDSSGTSSVQYATSDSSGLNNCDLITGNASARCDYTAVGGTLTFAPGELSKTFTIPIVNDIFVEGPETLTVTLSSATVSSLAAPSSATLTITDDDSAVGAANPLDTREFFVRQLYLDTLNREPEPSGLAAWLNRLNTCPQPGETLQNCDEIEVTSAFFRSPEAFDRSYFIYRFYEGALVRQPQYEEFQADLRRLTGFLTPEELEQRKREFAEEFVNRPEFHTLYDSFGSGQPFVDAVLARAGAAREGAGAAPIVTANRTSVINRLAAGQITRGQALRELMESAEVSRRFFNKAFVVVEYFSFLRRNPDAAYLHWINLLNTTSNYREMIRGFLQSPEYRSRFGPM